MTWHYDNSGNGRYGIVWICEKCFCGFRHPPKIGKTPSEDRYLCDKCRNLSQPSECVKAQGELQ